MKKKQILDDTLLNMWISLPLCTRINLYCLARRNKEGEREYVRRKKLFSETRSLLFILFLFFYTCVRHAKRRQFVENGSHFWLSHVKRKIEYTHDDDKKRKSRFFFIVIWWRRILRYPCKDFGEDFWKCT